MHPPRRVPAKSAPTDSKNKPPEGLGSEELEKWNKQQAYHRKQASKYRSRIQALKSESKLKNIKPDDLSEKANENNESGLCDPAEEIIQPTLFESSHTHEKLSCEPATEPDDPSLKRRTISKDTSILDIELKVVKRTFTLESEVIGGDIVSSTKRPKGLGPDGFSLTWNSIASLVSLSASYCIPLNRLAAMLKNDFGAFSSGQISKILKWTAELMVPIYLYLADELADLSHLSGDDTSSRTIEMQAEQETISEDSPFHAINERLGRASLLKDGSGFKKRLTLSVVTGRTDLQDKRSWIFFFRSHFGDLGNLVSRILSARSPKKREITIQSDLASFNKLEPMITSLFKVTQAGCAAHGRRPIWKYRKDDPGFCYFLLRCFLALARIERLLKEKQAEPNEILKYRRLYARKVWSIILDRCKQLTGEIPRRGDGEHCYRWPPDSDIFRGARYIIRNYQALTEYLENPEVFLTNNLCERLLRRAKMIINGSKFRKNETGRITFDVLQTMVATCTAAEVKLRQYIPYVWKHRDDLDINPQLYTPLAFAKLQSSENRDLAAS